MTNCSFSRLPWSRAGGGQVSPDLLTRQSRPAGTLFSPLGSRREQFADGAVGLVDGYVGVGRGAGVGIGNGDSTAAFTAEDMGSLPLGPVGVEQGIVFVAVAVGPAVDGNGCDVTRRIETAPGE